jgi:hypothetical protein
MRSFVKRNNMYLAKPNEEYNSSLYVSIFKNLENGKGTSYKEEINIVLLNAEKIIKGDLSLNSIGNEYFYLTSILIEKGQELLKGLTIDKIDKTIYNKVSLLLEENEIYA